VRLAQHVSQAQLAEVVKCSQGAISRFETGQRSALSEENVRALCGHLKIRFEEFPLSAPSQKSCRVVFCATPTCLHNLPFLLGGRLVVQPHTRSHDGEEPVFCPGCGACMCDCCPNPHCQSPPCEGAAFCAACGSPLVQLPEELRGLADPKSFVLFQWQQRDRFLGNSAHFAEGSVGCTTEGRPLTPALSPSDGERESGRSPHAVGQPED